MADRLYYIAETKVLVDSKLGFAKVRTVKIRSLLLYKQLRMVSNNA